MVVKKKYFKRLDLIRALSCVLVLLYHLNILKGGFLAVCTFFTLSGYLTCASALKKDEFSIKNYYINRIKKIYFPLLIVVFITVGIVKLIPSINWINLKQETTSVIFGYNNFWQLHANLDYFTRNVNSPFTHFWYISILMQFDLIFPIAFKYLKTKTKNITQILTVIILTITTTVIFFYMSKTQDIMMVYYNTVARSFSYFFGIFLAIMNCKYGIKLSRIFKKENQIIFILYLIALIILCVFMPDITKNYGIYMLITTLICTRLIEYSTYYSKKGMLDMYIKVLAKISYEVYLVQYPIIFFMQNIKINETIKIIIIILLTLIISLIMYTLINVKQKNKIFKGIKILFFSTIIIIGSFIVITEKDNTAEMKELENILNKNSKNIKQKNSEYMNNSNKENEEWNTFLKDMQSEEEKTAQIVANLPIVGVGDSVLLGTIDELYKRFPNGYFDGKVSRTISSSKDVLNDLKKNKKLGDIVVLSLATNGDYSDKKNSELMSILENREIYWINAVGADDPTFNEKFKAFASNYPNIHLVEWDKAAKNHPEYFYADGIHVKGDGIKAYVDTIYNTIYTEYLRKYNSENIEKMQKHEQEINNKITFYGDEVLTNAFTLLSKKINNANYNANNNYTFKKLYKEINEKIQNQTLEHKIVLMFEKKTNISESQYNQIIDLCKDHEIYIINITKNKYSFQNENVKIIDFYKEIKNNKDYLLADKIHLSKKGNKALVNLIIKEIK